MFCVLKRKHLVFFVVSFVNYIIPDVSKEVQEQIDREKHIIQKAIWEVNSEFLNAVRAESALDGESVVDYISNQYGKPNSGVSAARRRRRPFSSSSNNDRFRHLRTPSSNNDHDSQDVQYTNLAYNRDENEENGEYSF